MAGRVIRLRPRSPVRRMAALEGDVRRLRTRLEESASRLEQAVDVLTRLVRVVAIEHRRVKRRAEQLGERLDRVAGAVARARTADLRRLERLQRMLEALERR